MSVPLSAGGPLPVAELLAMPFLQRALLAGLLSGSLGGLLGSFAVLRQLSFFSDALGHSALLGITLGVLLGLDPTVVLIPFAVLFALGVNQLAQRSRLPSDALLNIIYSSSLALAVVALSIKAVGVLLISAFVVIPACAARLVSGNFRHYIFLAAFLGGICAVLGLLASAAFDLPSGPSVVVVQLLVFLLALLLSPRGGPQGA